MFRLGHNSINLGQPVNRSAPLNRGLVAWWKAMPHVRVGQRLTNICGGSDAAFVNAFGYTPLYSAIARDNFGSLRMFGSDSSGNPYYGVCASAFGVTGFPFTMAGTIRCDDLSAARTLCSFTEDAGSDSKYMAIVIDTNGSVYLTRRNAADPTNATSSAGLVTVGTWNHLIGTIRSSTDAELYVNGISVGTSTTSISLAASTDRMLIGRMRMAGSPVNYMDSGYISEVQFYNRQFNASDAWSLYNASRTGYVNELNRISRPIAVSAAAGAPATGGSFFGAGNYTVGA